MRRMPDVYKRQVMDSGRILDEFPHENATQDGIMKTIIDGGRKL